MEKFEIEGGHKLRGAVAISGSKNSSLPILAATLLTEEECIIRNVPDVSDTNYMLQILRSLGADVERSSGTVRITAKDIQNEAPYDLVRKMRASICVMGPLLARLHSVKVSLPGGCVIGDRPINLHIQGLAKFGADVEMDGGNILINADKLEGCEIDMGGSFGSTVLGTDNIMMAAAIIPGVTVIENSACEPEVVDLADMLNKMGAEIEGAGTARITIRGVEKLKGVDHTVIPDRIEAGTFLVAGAMCGGKDGISLLKANLDHLKSVVDILKSSGHEIYQEYRSVRVIPAKKPIGNDIVTMTYPGFPTDMQAQMTALFTITKGISVVTEKVFPNRFMHVAELSRMGADISLQDSTAHIRGVEVLSAAPVMASDLRASAALVLAALRAKGTTEIRRIYHIDRGYENIDDKLLTLGANIIRSKD